MFILYFLPLVHIFQSLSLYNGYALSPAGGVCVYVRAGLLCMSRMLLYAFAIMKLLMPSHYPYIEAGYANWIRFFDWVLYLTLEYIFQSFFLKRSTAVQMWYCWIELLVLLLLMMLMHLTVHFLHLSPIDTEPLPDC